MSEINIDTAAPFAKFLFAPDVEAMALESVSPYFLAYLQNKTADYAEQLVTEDLQFDPDPTKQVKSLVRHAVLKARVEMLRELMAEITAAQTPPSA